MRIPLSSLVLALSVAIAASSMAGATTWQVTTVDPVAVYANYGSMRLDAAGEPHISSWPANGLRYIWRDVAGWHGETVPQPTSPQNATLPAGGEAAIGELPHPDDTELLNFLLSSIALDPAGLAHIAWTRNNNVSTPTLTPVWYASRSSSGWTTEAAGPELGDDPSLDIDSNGRPSIAYANASYWATQDAALHFVRKDSGVWSAVAVIDAHGWQPSLLVDAQGVPHVAYGSPAGVRYASLVSGSWVSEFVADGSTPSLAFGPDGEPRIAYLLNGHVALAEHKAGSWLISIVDSQSGVDVDVSLAITPMGEPRIAYESQGSFRPWFAERNFGVWTTGAIDPSADGYNEQVGVGADGRVFVAWAASDGLRWAQQPQVTAVPAAPSPAAFAITGRSPIRTGEPLRFRIDLASPKLVSFDLFDLAGRVIAHRESESLPAGSSRIAWSPDAMRPGLYLVRASDASHVLASLRLVVLR